jgi:hypothetical protein
MIKRFDITSKDDYDTSDNKVVVIFITYGFLHYSNKVKNHYEWVIVTWVSTLVYETELKASDIIFSR